MLEAAGSYFNKCRESMEPKLDVYNVSHSRIEGTFHNLIGDKISCC